MKRDASGKERNIEMRNYSNEKTYGIIRLKKDIAIFWIVCEEQIEELLDIFGKINQILISSGFTVKEVKAFGGVHERDTGYEDFCRHYDSFEECKELLVRQFQADSDKLDGTWFDTLNFGNFSMTAKCNGEFLTAEFKDNKITVSGNVSNDKLAEKICKSINDEIYG